MFHVKSSTKILSLFISLALLTSCSQQSGNNHTNEDQKANISNYVQLREDLVNSNSYKTGSELVLNEKEKSLDERLKTLINTYETYTDDSTYAPANPFYHFIDGEGIDEIVFTPLYKLIYQMPKGGNLHLHTTATFNTENFLNFLLTQSNIYIAPTKLVDSNGKEIPEGSIRIFNSKDEVIDGFLPLHSALESGQVKKERLSSLWTIDEADEAIPHVWDEFNTIFSRIGWTHGVDKQLFKGFYREAFLEQLKDNVTHIELRSGITQFDGDSTGEIALKLLRDVYYDLKKDYPDFTLKVIITTIKVLKKDPADVKKDINNMISLKEKVKDEYDPNNIVDFIVGFDLVNAEDDGHQLIEYSQYINELRDEGKQFDLYLHAGESVLPDSRNMIDAYLLESKRVGHGINLFRFPSLMEKVKEKGIALEVCPISNQLLRYCYDLRTHPAVEYLKRDIPFTICSDDPLVFNSKGLSFDFFEAIAGWHLGIAQIKQLCINSIKYSATTNTEKDKMMKIWEGKWNEFIDNNYQSKETDNQIWY